ncbi:hypothetical protein DFH08DRAFT_805925 [Mycena albidolilacea]|uniref:Uncharacterized protein n=1 Tax=Mycena albidolilacea TaxID=1033008 RepID=A0AAD7A781_9AGAR|nr:hypothetical protein DFH08DRAFT_805925 [Mycena albidolilacea]
MYNFDSPSPSSWSPGRLSYLFLLILIRGPSIRLIQIAARYVRQMSMYGTVPYILMPMGAGTHRITSAVPSVSVCTAQHYSSFEFSKPFHENINHTRLHLLPAGSVYIHCGGLSPLSTNKPHSLLYIPVCQRRPYRLPHMRMISELTSTVFNHRPQRDMPRSIATQPGSYFPPSIRIPVQHRNTVTVPYRKPSMRRLYGNSYSAVKFKLDEEQRG